VGEPDINEAISVEARPTDAYEAAATAGNLVVNNSNFIHLIKTLSDLIETKQRSIQDIFDGKLAYSEIIAFKLCKYKVDPVTNVHDAQPLQSFYFPNLGGAAEDNIKEISYHDTQVKYGHKYAYKVYAYTLVIGDQYNYNNSNNEASSLQSAPGDTAIAALNGEMGTNIPTVDGTIAFINQWPSVQIIEEPYVDLGIMMVADLPPSMPEVEVIPFRAVNDKIRFLIQRQEGSYAINPDNFIINSSDVPKYNDIRIAQNIPIGAPIVFATDNVEPAMFEIYRIDTKPASYRDFEGALLAMLEAITPSGGEASAYSYDDTSILPNKKYYYTFRSVDPHGQLSTATPVYEVELVDDNGRIYPIINIIPLSPVSAETTTTKSLRKLLQIDAALPQQIVNTTNIDPASEGPSAPPSSLVLTTQAEGIWSPALPQATGDTPITDEKVFKIRVTSKQTSKKLDLNVRFIENPIANPHEQD
jgi:hypothetical protein